MTPGCERPEGLPIEDRPRYSGCSVSQADARRMLSSFFLLMNE